MASWLGPRTEHPRAFHADGLGSPPFFTDRWNSAEADDPVSTLHLVCSIVS